MPDSDVLRKLEENRDRSSTASVVWYELAFGAARLEDPRRRTTIEEYLALLKARGIEILEYDEGASIWQAHENARLVRLGIQVPFRDAQIAATAAVRGMTVVTANP